MARPKKAKVMKEIVIDAPKYTPTTSQTDLIGVINSMKEKDFDVAPFFQREYVWDAKDESYLIETIILGYSIPTFFAYENTDKHEDGSAWTRTLFSDGQQRLTAIYKFIYGEMKSEKTGRTKGKYKLKGLKRLPELNGLGWDDFKNCIIKDTDGKLIDMQKRIKQYKLTISVFPDDTPIEVIQDHYTRLNTSGENLSHAAVRRNKFFSKYYVSLMHLANNETYLEILGNNGCGKKKKQQEHESYSQLWGWSYFTKVFENGKVRYTDNPNNKDKAVDKHLEHMRDNPSVYTPELQAEMEAAFLKATNLVSRLFGDKAFRKPNMDKELYNKEGKWDYKWIDEANGIFEFGPFNEAMYECLMYFFSYADEQTVIKNQTGIVNAIYAAIKNDMKFHDSLHLRARTKKSAEVRFPTFYTILKDQGVKFNGI